MNKLNIIIDLIMMTILIVCVGTAIYIRINHDENLNNSGAINLHEIDSSENITIYYGELIENGR